MKVDTNATSLSGYAGRFMLNKNRGQFSINAAVGLLSPGFEVNDIGYSPYSDVINAHIFAAYRFNEPTKYYQFAGLNLAAYSGYDFGGNITSNGYRFGGYITLPDVYYNGNFVIAYNPETYNSRRTRGGPLTINPISRIFNLNLNSDNRFWWVASLSGTLRSGDDYNSKYIYTGIQFKVLPTLTLEVGPSFQFDKYQAQYIGTFNDQTAVKLIIKDMFLPILIKLLLQQI